MPLVSRPQTMPRSAKMLQFVNWRIRVTIADNRELVGTFLAFDKHMNLVLGDCEEFRRVVPKGKKGAISPPPLSVCEFVSVFCVLAWFI